MENQLRYLFLCLFLLNREIASTKQVTTAKILVYINKMMYKIKFRKTGKSNLENKSISRFSDDYIFLSADKLMSRFSGKIDWSDWANCERPHQESSGLQHFYFKMILLPQQWDEIISEIAFFFK